jgi:riboflavin kinase
VKPTKLNLLCELCKRGAAVAPAKATTIDLAKSLRVSQQTVSRWLAELAAEGFVKREGKKTRFSAAACKELKSLAAALEAKPASAEKTAAKMVLRGVVVRGLGEGAKFMRLLGYARQLRAALRWAPFPGTLNLKLDGESAGAKKRLESLPGVFVKSFVEGDKRFGRVKLFPCVAVVGSKRIEGAVILPEKSFYGESVLEVVSPLNLRDKLLVRDGSTVSVLVSA